MPGLSRCLSMTGCSMQRQALDVLEVHSHGVGIKSIAASYKESGDTYWTEWRVRQVIEAAKDREGSVRKP